MYSIVVNNFYDFPGASVDKNPPASAGDSGSTPGPGSFRVPEHALQLLKPMLRLREERPSSLKEE